MRISLLCLVFLSGLVRPALALQIDKLSGGDSFQSAEGRKKIPVIIYIANDIYAPSDTPFDKNKLAIREKIAELAKTSTQKSLFENIGAKFIHLGSTVQRAINYESTVLKDICQKGLNRDRFAIVVVRNFGNDITAWSDPDHFQFWRPFDYFACTEKKAGGLGETLEIGYFKDFRLEAQPLSSAKTFNALLRDVEKQFPQENYRYLLWLRSVGGRETAVQPLLDLEADRVSTEDLEKKILANPYFTDPKATEKEWGEQGFEFFSQLNLSIGGPESGMKKIDILTLLNRYGGFSHPDRAMYFPVVYLDAPFSDLRLAKDPEIVDVIKKGGGSLEKFDTPAVGKMVTHDAKDGKFSVPRNLDLLTQPCDEKIRSCDIQDLFLEAIRK